MPWLGIPDDAKTRSIKPEIRIVDLMTMTAGLSYNTVSRQIRQMREETDSKATTRDMMGALAQMPLLCEPRRHWMYSLAHDVLAAVVEVVSGMSFYEYLKMNIFEPLEITDMYFSVPESMLSKVSALYTADMQTKALKEIEKVNSYRLSENYESGGAGIECTVDAYAKFADAMCCGGCKLQFMQDDTEYSVTIAMDGSRSLNTLQLGDSPTSKLCLNGYWSKPGTFTVIARWIETCSEKKIDYTFVGNQIDIQDESTVGGFGPMRKPEQKATAVRSVK